MYNSKMILAGLHKYNIAGNFWEKNLSQISSICKSFFWKIWEVWHHLVAPAVSVLQFFFSAKILLSTNSRNWRGKAWSILSCKWHQCPPRLTERGRSTEIERMHFADIFFVFEPRVVFFHFANVWNSTEVFRLVKGMCKVANHSCVHN